MIAFVHISPAPDCLCVCGRARKPRFGPHHCLPNVKEKNDALRARDDSWQARGGREELPLAGADLSPDTGSRARVSYSNVSPRRFGSGRRAASFNFGSNVRACRG